MGTHRKQVIAGMIAAAAMLSGCIETVSETEAREQMAAAKQEAEREHARANMLELELKKVRSELAAGEDQRRAEIEYGQKLAGIAAACDALLPVCSDAVADPGRVAQAAGFSGGGLLYAVALLVKLLGLGLLFVVVGTTAVSIRRLLKAKLEAPAKAEIEAAKALLKEAERSQAALQAATAELTPLRAEASTTNAEIAAVQERIKSLQAEEQRLTAAIEKLNAELQSLEKIRRALQGK